MQVTQSLHRAVQQDPDRPLTIYRHRSRTVAESADRVARLAGALRALEVDAGDRVGMLALNSDRYHESLLAVPWAGGVVNPVNTRWSTAEIAYSLADCQAEVLLVDDAFSEVVPDLCRQTESVRAVIFCGEGETPDGMLDYEHLVRSTDPAEDARRADDDLYGVFYTGGTAGRPTGVRLSHRAMLTGVTGMLAGGWGTRDATLLHVAPMFHLAALTLWNNGLLTGATHVMVPSFSPAAVVEAIAKYAVTSVLLVPTMLQMIIDSPEAAGADLSSVREVAYGASPISTAVLERARATLSNAAFVQAYGMTGQAGGRRARTRPPRLKHERR